jgi:hypothetical protein
MIRSFSAVGQWRRRSTLEMTSQAMYLTVLSHVLKDSILHLILSGVSYIPHRDFALLVRPATGWLGYLPGP